MAAKIRPGTQRHRAILAWSEASLSSSPNLHRQRSSRPRHPSGRCKHEPGAPIQSVYQPANRCLVAGLEARLQVAAEALLQAAASGSIVDLSRAATLVRLATSHDRAGDQSQRVERLAMAARLCRWLMTSRRPSADFVSAARAYAEDGGFADRAR